MSQIKVTFSALLAAVNQLTESGLNAKSVSPDECFSQAIMVPVALRLWPDDEDVKQYSSMDSLCALIFAGFSALEIWQKFLSAHFVKGAEVEVADPIHGVSIHSCSFTGNAIAINHNVITVRDMELECWDLEPIEIASIVVYSNTLSANDDETVSLDEPPLEEYFSVVESTSEIVSATSFEEAIDHYVEELGSNAMIPDTVQIQKYIRGIITSESSIFKSNLENLVENLDENYGCVETSGDYSISDKAKELYSLFAEQIASEYPVTQLCKSGAPVPVTVAKYTEKLF